MMSWHDGSASTSLRAAARERPLLGTFMKLPRREVVDTLALSGFDFLICDMEHGQVSEREACDVVLAGVANGLPVVVRVAAADPGLMNRLLEWGAAGIQVPHVESVDQAVAAQRAARYPPAGQRSASLAQPAAVYGRRPASEVLSESNERVAVVGQLETTIYHDELTAIVSRLDIAFIGTFDLSIHAGHPGDLHHEDVRSVIRDIEEAASETETPLGAFVADVEACRQALRSGYRYIAYSSDLALLGSSARHVIQELSALRSDSPS